MTISEFEYGKTRIMAEARAALRRIGIEYHCVMFDVHGSQPLPEGATPDRDRGKATPSAGWFPADEIEDSRDPRRSGRRAAKNRGLGGRSEGKRSPKERPTRPADSRARQAVARAPCHLPNCVRQRVRKTRDH